MRLVLLPSLTVLFLSACGGVSESGDPDAAPQIDASTDPCDTNTCECEVDDDCGEFEVCDTTSTPGRVCVCAAAYADDGGGCAFAGAPGDPGFQADDVWSGSNAARVTFDPNAAGSIDTGVASLTPDGVCVFDSISQTFTMPPRDRSEAFAVDVSYFADTGGGFGAPRGLVLINGGWHVLNQQEFGFGSTTFCLGEGGYGGDVEFAITAAEESFSCSGTPDTSLRFDRLAVRPALAGECPDIGEAINGDAEGNSGWTFSAAGGGAAAFAEGVGAGNSRGIRLTRTTTASSATATTKISIPATPNAAIELFSAGTSNAVFEVLLGGQAVSRLNPNGLRRVCVPEWAKGTVQDVSLMLRQVMGTGSPINRPETVDLDAISVVSDPGCGDDPNQYDNGFETFYNSVGLAPGWAVTIGGVNGVEAPAIILNSPGNAHAGNGSIRLTATNVCNTALARRDIMVPASVGAAGPAIKAFVNIPNSPTGRGGLRFSTAQFGSVSEVAGVEGAGYQEVTLCIPPKFIGRRLTIEAFGSGGGGGCSNIPSENTFVDDVSITTDASCAP